MSLRTIAMVSCASLLTLTACGREPPSPSAEGMAQAPAVAATDTAPVELAGGLPTETAAAAGPDTAPGIPGVAPELSSAPPLDPSAAPHQLIRVSRTPELDGPAPPLAGSPEDVRRNDPLERMNRRLYAMDRVVGTAMVQPGRMLQRQPRRTPAFVTAARNVLNNLDEPDVAANDLLQHKFGRALTSAVRFVINSTLGLGGISDAAGKMGLTRRPNNIDRTLASYGAPAGPYLFLPIAGPMTLRAAVGAVGVGYLYPPHWLHLAAGVGAALRAASYAQLAGSTMDRADPIRQAAPGHDGYLKARKTYFEARGGPPAQSGATDANVSPAAAQANASGGGRFQHLDRATAEQVVLVGLGQRRH